jgi:hypothetical protein
MWPDLAEETAGEISPELFVGLCTYAQDQAILNAVITDL